VICLLAVPAAIAIAGVAWLFACYVRRTGDLAELIEHRRQLAGHVTDR
jgi:hypothetical protein